jgi:hypothetical protein
MGQPRLQLGEASNCGREGREEGLGMVPAMTTVGSASPGLNNGSQGYPQPNPQNL